ncbi:hypothetical protein HDE76_004147 [Rhodanobacter sp. ANJX3]|uniref:hypothetical protein n=1 Tax=unclassified Rhodanobacter TaxID=2621553 RepID=UPI0015C8AA8A|nr:MULTISPECIES: hypothetical protein [unclassified Rhodanobacter]MBB5360895.1 hypothetical protein [Rhodanobacter sp. ANJX3]NYE30646.1 hypothetical protein [Rhodanobacter sp. K2T2]
MAFYLYILGVLATGGLLAWNLYRRNRMSTEPSNDDSAAAIKFIGFGRTPYELIPDDRPPASDCYVKDGAGSSVATFESMSLSGDTLHIDHFALDGSLKGSGLGETVLRGFARLVAEQAPQINRITFDLYRVSEGSDIVKLAQARYALLKRIGAHSVFQRQPNEYRICVSGTWDKPHWSN